VVIDAQVGQTIWSRTIKVDADGYSSFAAGGTVVDSYANGDGEMIYVAAQPHRGTVRYHHIAATDVDGAPSPINVKFIRSLAQAMRTDADRNKTDRHLHAQLVLSVVLAANEPQRKLTSK
jgi:hypothetical protein